MLKIKKITKKELIYVDAYYKWGNSDSGICRYRCVGIKGDALTFAWYDSDLGKVDIAENWIRIDGFNKHLIDGTYKLVDESDSLICEALKTYQYVQT